MLHKARSDHSGSLSKRHAAPRRVDGRTCWDLNSLRNINSSEGQQVLSAVLRQEKQGRRAGGGRQIGGEAEAGEAAALWSGMLGGDEAKAERHWFPTGLWSGPRFAHCFLANIT